MGPEVRFWRMVLRDEERAGRHGHTHIIHGLGWVAGWLGGWVAGWLGGWLPACLPACLPAWVAGWLGGWHRRSMVS